MPVFLGVSGVTDRALVQRLQQLRQGSFTNEDSFLLHIPSGYGYIPIGKK